MKKLVYVFIVLLLVSCSVEYEKQREIILTNVQTIEEGNVLDLNAEIVSIEFETLATNEDSLKEIAVNWSNLFEKEYLSYSDERDSIYLLMAPIIEDMSKGKKYDSDRFFELDRKWDMSRDNVDHNRRLLLIGFPYDTEYPIGYKNDMEARKDIKYNIYKCTYKAFNPALQVDQTLTKHFVFNQDQTKIIRRY